MAGMNPASLPHVGLVLGTTDKTLSCEAGSFTLSGQNATVSYTGGGVGAPAPFPHLSLLLAAGEGSDKTLACDAGAFTLTGRSATTKAGWRLTAAAGSFTFSGQDATFDKVGAASVEFPAPLPMFSLLLTGSVVDRRLACLTGSFAVSGVVASLNRGVSLALETGSFTVSGAPAERDIQITAASGSFALSGQAAGLVKVWLPMTFSPGTFVLSGQDAGFRYNQSGIYRFQPLAGQFLVAGSAADFVTSPRVLCDVGEFTVTGSSADLRYSGGQKKYGGFPKRRTYRKRYVVEIDGKEFVVESLEEARDLLAMARAAAEELASQAKAQPVRIPRIRAKGPAGPELTELVSEVAGTREQIKSLYNEIQQTAEIRRLLQEQDDEEALLALL